MSISRFQEKFLAKGCGTAILIGCAAVFGGLAFSYFGKGPGGGGSDSEGHVSKDVANVAGIPVQATMIESIVQQEQQGADPTTVSPASQASQYGEAVNLLLEKAAVVSIAKADGVTFTDDQIRESVKQQIAQQLERFKIGLMMRGTIKPDASDSDVDKMVKAQTGKSIAELQQKALSDVNEALKDSTKRDGLVQDMARPVLASLLAAKINPSDAELKASYDQDTFKRILIKDKPAPSPSVADRISQVQKDLSSGTSFEQAMDRYSDEAPLPKKKVSENQISMSASQLKAEKPLAALKTLKLGGTSEPIKTPEGTSIYKLTAVSNQAPADFAKNISKYRKQFQTSAAESSLNDQVKEVVASKTEWLSKGYQAVYDATRPDSDPKKAQAIYQEAKLAITKTDGSDLRVAQLAEYASFDAIWNAPDADKAKLTPDRIQVLNDYLQSMENFSVRLELVRLYESTKDGKDALASLLAAARSNNSYDRAGQSRFGDIAASLVTLRSANLVSPAEVKAVEDAQAEWKKDKAEFDAAEAQRKAEEQAAAKKEEEEAKKAAEEAKKAAKNGPAIKVKDSSSSLPPVLSTPSTSPAPGSVTSGPSGFVPAPSAGTTGGNKG